jgi:hypothetical protein
MARLTLAHEKLDCALHRRQIEATDVEIEALVCESYRLTEEEIAMVEGREEYEEGEEEQ